MVRLLVSLLIFFLITSSCSEKKEIDPLEDGGVADLIYGEEEALNFEQFQEDMDFLISKNDMEKLKEKVEKAEKKYPDKKAYLAFYYGVYYFIKNDLPKALDFFKQSENVMKGETLYYYGHIARRQNQFDKAEKYYLEALKILKTGDVQSSLADLYYENKKMAQAKNAYLKAIEMNPNNTMDRYFLANIYFQEKKLEESEKLLKEALSIDGSFKKGYIGLYAIYDQKKDKKKSLYYQCRALLLDQKYKEIIQILEKEKETNEDQQLSKFYIISLLREGLTRKAEEIILLVEKKFGMDPDLALYKGSLLSLNGNKKEAEEYFYKMIEKYPNHFNLMAAYADVLNETGKVEKAIVWYEKALLLEPENTSYRYSLAEIYRKKGDIDREYFHRGVLYLYQQLINEAIEALVRVKNPDYPSYYHYYLAKAYASKNNLEEAEKHLSISIEKNKLFYRSYLDLAYVLVKQNKRQKALEILSRYPQKNTEVENLKNFISKM